MGIAGERTACSLSQYLLGLLAAKGQFPYVLCTFFPRVSHPLAHTSIKHIHTQKVANKGHNLCENVGRCDETGAVRSPHRSTNYCRFCPCWAPLLLDSQSRHTTDMNTRARRQPESECKGIPRPSEGLHIKLFYISGWAFRKPFSKENLWFTKSGSF